jgi:hypothetical protein
VYTGFWWGDVIEREELGLHGTVITKWIFKKWDGETMTVELAQYRDGWRIL